MAKDNYHSVILNPAGYNTCGVFFMELDSLRPFVLIILQVFGIVFLVEALVIYFFNIKRFWPAVGIAVIINLLAMIVLYAGASFTGKLGYELNGLQLPIQLMLFLWWLSVMTDALLLRAFTGKRNIQQHFAASLLMNTLSCLFLYFFVLNGS